MPVLVPYRYIVATRMLYADFKGASKVIQQQDYTIQQQDSKINFLDNSLKSCIRLDSTNKAIRNIDSVLLVNNSNEIAGLRKSLRKNILGKLTASVMVPAAAVASFLLGWFLNK